MVAEAGSGIRHMSDSWIAFQPAIEEPSNIWPSENVSSSIMPMSKVTCCHLPRGSVKRKSAYLTSLSLMSFRTSLAVVMDRFPCPELSERCFVGLAGADAHRVLQAEHEDFAVADLTGLGRPDDGFRDLVDLVARNGDFDLELGQEVRRVFGTAIDLGVPLL